jgi:hypothetical protein
MRRRSPAGAPLLLALALVAPGSARADDGLIARPEAAIRPGTRPTLASPIRLRAGDGKLARSLWTPRGLYHRAPRTHPSLRAVLHAGAPVYDPQSGAFFASAEGSVVELRADGALRVLLAGVQGLDLDVRASVGLCVSREPDHRVVLHRTLAAARRTGLPEQRTLLQGERFFAPRLSPNGRRVLVHESRAGGGHLWLVEQDGRATDLGQGYDGVWHPNGKEILFTRVAHDGSRLTSGDLHVLELSSRSVRCLARTPNLIEVEPAISPDGRYLAFQDARGGDLYLARLAPGGER